VTQHENQTNSYNLTYRSDKESALTYNELDDNFRYFAEAIQSSEGYVHDSGDGNHHVPATGVGNNGKVLTAGEIEGSLSWTTPASTYTLPTASASVLGGIKIGTNLTISNGVLSSEDTNTTYSGTGLIIIDGSNVISTTANNYIHPTGSGDDFSVDTGALTGATVVSDIDINVTTDTLGHVTDANGSVTTRTLTLANLGYTGATNANFYIHPTTAGNNHIPLGGSPDQYLKYSSSGVATWATITTTGNFVPSDSSSTITGTLTATDFIINSDRRLKSNIKNLEIEVLHLLSEINPVTFNDGDIGFIAQDFEDRVPELVSSGDDGYLALKYSKITALLWKQNQELLKRIEVLENR
jgi:hypothetical protein